MNAAQLLTGGGFETGEDGSPFEVVAQEPMYRLRRFFRMPTAADGQR
ncbi:MAG TPA: hypothetical protein VK281_01215 [Xanthobacteraceae bacterium]|nr:hypothetical protein [Xanthobacteraceae bacterium]